MIDKTATADRVRAMLDASPWEYSVDDDDPTLFTLDFETSVRDDLRVSVIAGEDWVYVSHIFARNPTENQAAIHRRLLEINWVLNGCKFAVDEDGDLVLLTELLAEDLDESELISSIGAIVDGSEEYYEELAGMGVRQ